MYFLFCINPFYGNWYQTTFSHFFWGRGYWGFGLMRFGVDLLHAWRMILNSTVAYK